MKRPSSRDLQLLAFEDRHMDEHVVFITYARAVMSELAGVRPDLIRGSGRPYQFATPHYHSNTVEGTDQLMRDIRAARIDEVKFV